MTLMRYGLGIGRIVKATLFGKSTKLSASLTVPNNKISARNVTLDPSHCAAYNNITESWTNNEHNGVHLMYPAMFTAPLQFEVMSSDSFPFPLLGLVHLNNRIQQFDHITLDTKCRVDVHVEDKLLLHEKGYIVNVVSDVYCENSQKLLWKSTSGLFHFNKGASSEMKSTPLDSQLYQSEIKQEDVTGAGVQERETWHHASDKGRQYARVSKDFNPIHLSAASASLFGFKQGAIMHGMWTKARVVTALMPPTRDLCSSGTGAPMAEVFVEFKTPLYLPSTTLLKVKELAATSSADAGADAGGGGGGGGDRKEVLFEVCGGEGERLPHVRGKCSWMV